MSEQTRQYRKKPVVIEAVQYVAENDEELMHFLEGCTGWRVVDGPAIVIPTLEGDHRADPGDWIIKGVAGEFYPCKPDIFSETYEPGGMTPHPQNSGRGEERAIPPVPGCASLCTAVIVGLCLWLADAPGWAVGGIALLAFLGQIINTRITVLAEYLRDPSHD